MTAYQKRVRAYIEGQAPVCADHIICKRDGALEIRRGYFYAFGMTAEAWAASVEQALRTADIPAIVTGRDDRADWPKTSYFTAIVKEPQP